MDGFEWAWDNLAVRTPDEAQAQGLNIYFAPNLPTGEKVVDMADGSVKTFHGDEERPQSGYFAEYVSLERYCLNRGFPLAETNGQMSLLAVGGRAGDPLGHAGQ